VGCLWKRKRKKLIGKLIVITGAANGIGRLCALNLIKLGAFVACLDVDRKGLETLKEEIKALGASNSKVYVCDVSEKKSVESVVECIGHDFKGVNVDIVINCAAIVGKGKMFVNDEIEDFRKVFDVNTIGSIRVMKKFISGMVERDKGRIINIASTAGRAYCCRLSAYCASKAALIQFHHSLRLELVKLQSKVGTSLLMPWQVGDTKMFSGVRLWFPLNYIFPPLLAQNVAARIISMASEEGTTHHVETMPAYYNVLITTLSFLPTTLTDWIMMIMGGGYGMDMWLEAKRG